MPSPAKHQGCNAIAEMSKIQPNPKSTFSTKCDNVADSLCPRHSPGSLLAARLGKRNQRFCEIHVPQPRFWGAKADASRLEHRVCCR